MHIEAQKAITDTLQAAEGPVTFPEMKERTGLKGQDLRSGLKELLHDDSTVYVHGVEDREKQYGLRNGSR